MSRNFSQPTNSRPVYLTAMVLFGLLLVVGGGGYLYYLSASEENGAGEDAGGLMARSVAGDEVSRGQKTANVETPQAVQSASDDQTSDERIYRPDPAPKLPEEFDAFDPPKPTAAEEVGVSQWTRTAGPDETLAIGGYGFTDGGASANFQVFAQADGETVKKTVEPVILKPYRAVVTLPQDLPENGMYAVYPTTDAGRGRPAFINRPELWFHLPQKQVGGKVASVYGRNLSHDHGKEKSWIYLKPDGRKKLGQWAEITQVNPYKVDFIVPESLPTGKYEVWVHNGHGGAYGWHPLHSGKGGPTGTSHLTIIDERKWDGPTIDVTDMGAVPDDDKADHEAILKALEKANKTKNATIYFPAGTYYLKKPIRPISGPDKSGMRIMGAGKRKTFIKGHPDKKMGNMMHITGGNVIIRDLTISFNHLPEKRKFYSDWERPEHSEEHYTYLAKLKKVRNERKKWQKKNKGEEAPDRLKDPESPGFPEVEKRHKLIASGKGYRAGDRDMITKDGYDSGLEFINCVLDAERQRIRINGFKDGLMRNCDVVANECILHAPARLRIEGCHFYGRGDSAMMIYTFGGWNISVTNCTGEDYMPNTYDTSLGRFFTTSAYGNRPENYYFGNNRTKDLTVNPMHYNQNSGEQIMWEHIRIEHTANLKGLEVHEKNGREKLVFDEKIRHKKSAWYYDILITRGKGIGQYRKVANFVDGDKAVTVHGEPFAVKPDESSRVEIGQTVHRVIVYDNYFDGKPRAYKADHHIASTGVLAFGAAADFIIEGNTFHELRGSMSGLGSHGGGMFARYQDNKIIKVRKGLGEAGPLGIIRGNHVKQGGDRGLWVRNGGNEDYQAIHVFEHNLVEDTPVGVQMGRRLKKKIENAHTYFHKNRFKYGKGSLNRDLSIGLQTLDDESLIMEGNQFDGFSEEVGNGK